MYSKQDLYGTVDLKHKNFRNQMFAHQLKSIYRICIYLTVKVIKDLKIEKLFLLKTVSSSMRTLSVIKMEHFLNFIL